MGWSFTCVGRGREGSSSSSSWQLQSSVFSCSRVAIGSSGQFGTETDHVHSGHSEESDRMIRYNDWIPRYARNDIF